MKFIDCLMKCDKKSIVDYFFDVDNRDYEYFCIKESKADYSLYQKVISNLIDELIELSKEDNIYNNRKFYFVISEVVSFKHSYININTDEITSENSDIDYMLYAFINENRKENHALNFIDWKEIIHNTEVSDKSIKKYGLNTCVGVILDEMTEDGFSYEGVKINSKELKESIDSALKEIENAKKSNSLEKYHPFKSKLSDKEIENIRKKLKLEMTFNQKKLSEVI